MDRTFPASIRKVLALVTYRESIKVSDVADAAEEPRHWLNKESIHLAGWCKPLVSPVTDDSVLVRRT